MLANTSMCHNKITSTFETKHSNLEDHPLSYLETILKELKMSKTKIEQFAKANGNAMHVNRYSGSNIW